VGAGSPPCLVVIGAAFLLSGVVNVLVLNTPLNLLAFQIPNVIFSFIAGALLLFLGAWGRFSGGLPDNNQYQRERHENDGKPAPLPTTFNKDPEDATAARELAEAERAVARRTASSEVTARIDAVHDFRREEDRVQEWRKREG
jgi:hypothetical protein